MPSFSCRLKNVFKCVASNPFANEYIFLALDVLCLMPSATFTSILVTLGH